MYRRRPAGRPTRPSAHAASSWDLSARRHIRCPWAASPAHDATDIIGPSRRLIAGGRSTWRVSRRTSLGAPATAPVRPARGSAGRTFVSRGWDDDGNHRARAPVSVLTWTSLARLDARTTVGGISACRVATPRRCARCSSSRVGRARGRRSPPTSGRTPVSDPPDPCARRSGWCARGSPRQGSRPRASSTSTATRSGSGSMRRSISMSRVSRHA